MMLDCPICGMAESQSIYRAKNQPALLNFLYQSKQAARQAAVVDLEFRGCRSCGFVWNAAFKADAIEYRPGYVNDQSNSPRFQDHLEQVICRLAAAISTIDGAILEIGCGQGRFLEALCRKASRTGLGFDPAFARDRTSSSIEVHAEPFNADCLKTLGGRKVSLIVCRHVFEHLPRPVEMIGAIRELLQRNRGALLYLEVPSFDWIATHRCFFDFFHEHCSLFNRSSMGTLLRKAGLRPVEIEAVFEDQYLGVVASIGDDQSPRIDADATGFDHLAKELIQTRERWRERIDDLLITRPLLPWGAGAKCVSFLNQLGFGDEQIPHAVDINPLKQNRFLPTSAQQVIAPQQVRTAFADDFLSILVMNPGYREEISQCVRTLELDAELVILDRSTNVAIHR
jgi:hypothetical protein